MIYYSFMVLCSCKLISQSANMGKTQEKKKISQKSQDLNFIKQMKISKNNKIYKKSKEWFEQKYE